MQGRFRQYNVITELVKKHSHSTYLVAPIGKPEGQMVLTVFSASLFRFPHERENLLQKAQRIKQLQHPHILPIFDAGIEEDQPFVVRKYLPDGSLRTRLKELSPHRLKLREALTIVSQVGDALAYAYEHNILHGKLKPENILFDASGYAILTDFSLVNKKDAIIRDQSSEEYAFCYLAPEQFAGISDARSDQYALGCLTYELITGQVPFAAQSLASMMGQPSYTLPAPLFESVDDLPPTLEAAVFKTLAKDPDERFFDFSLFLEVIRSVLSPPPAFPILRSTPSHKNRLISHATQSMKTESAASPTRMHANSQLLTLSEVPSSSKDDIVVSVFASEPASSMPEKTDAARLETRSLSEILRDVQITTTSLAEQEVGSLLFAEDEVDELPSQAISSTAHMPSKDLTNVVSSLLMKKTFTRAQAGHKGRIIAGLVFLILVVGASSAYALFSPFGAIQSNLLRQPIQVMKQGGIIPQVPVQGPNTANTQPTTIGNAQGFGTNNHIGNIPSSTQSNGISTEQSPSQTSSQTSGISPSASTSPSSSTTPSPSTSPSTSTAPSSSTPASTPASTPTPAPTSAPQPSTKTINMTIYFSGWTDNSPPGGSIAYPQIHKTAGGTGTYADPITFAASKNALSPGTIIYVSFLSKYFIMEDDCDTCDSAWNSNHTYEISLWTGGDASTSPSAQQSCEDSLTPNSPQPVEVQPASDLTTKTTPLFTDSDGCIKLQS